MDYLDLRVPNGVSYVEAIKDGEIIRVPETVALMEDLFILRRIVSPAHQAEMALPSVSLQHAKRESTPKSSIMSEWKNGKFGAKKNNALQDLIPNFNWEISKNRKSRNWSRAKLASMINSTEEDVKRMEIGELPSDDFVLISRVEQLFGINLRKNPNAIAHVNLADLQKRTEQRKTEGIKTTAATVFKDSVTFTGNDIEVIDD